MAKKGRPRKGEEPTGYLGNDLLKRAKVQIDWTPELIEEVTKCATDPVYFIEEYVKIINLDEGLVKFVLRDYQNEIINSFENDNKVIIKIGRQAGKSTITIGYALYLLLFNTHYNIYLLAQDHSSAKELLSKVKLALENLPFFLQPGILKLNENAVHLENGSKIQAKATSKNAIRGRSAHCVICDEFAFVDSNMAQDFFASTWPTISSSKNTKFFIISTVNGFNLFYDVWINAHKKEKDGGNGFKPIEVHWSKVPGRDEAWKKKEIATIGQELFDREYECIFSTSSKSLISSEKISELFSKEKDVFLKDEEDNLNIYEKPIEGEQYVISVDTAKGVEKDYSAFSVIKVSKTPFEIVAVYRNNTISPLVFPEVIHRVGLNYNEAALLVENNEYGSQVLGILIYEYEYPNIIWTEITNKKQRISYGNDGKSSPGIRTSSYIKNVGCSNLKAIIEHDKLLIYDHYSITELSKFVKVKDSYQADTGANDDVTMTLVLFAWLTTQDYFKNIDQNVGEEIRDIYEDNINNNMLSFGFHNNGIKKERKDPFTDYQIIESEEDDDEFIIEVKLMMGIR